MDARSPRASHIVLIEDDVALLSALSFALEVEGYAVDAFGSAESALAGDLSEAGCFVVDYVLPHLNGLDLLRRLRARGSRVPAVLITSHPNARMKQEAAALATLVVEKPLLSDDLVETVRRLALAHDRTR